MKSFFSVVIPIFNEADNLISFFAKLDKNLKKLGNENEMLAIDDGSTDKTGQILIKLNKKYTNLKIFTLRKNFGKSAAYLVGFTKAKGDIIFTADSDGQDDTDELPKLLSKLNQGFDVIVGWRQKRSDSIIKKIISAIWNKLLITFSRINLHDSNSGLKAFRKKVLLKRYFRGDFHRYLPVVIGMDGYKVGEIRVNHLPRRYGSSKYGSNRIFPGISDFFTTIFLARYGYKPMHFFGPAGILVFSLGMLVNFYLLTLKLGGESIGGRPLLILGVLLTITGLQLIFTGFLSDLITQDSNNLSEDFLLQSN